ncbi:hypothetical protein M427DRAFT_134363 [Gonapodya prolifera JEL478]|uniref:Glucosidase 2 subunit beta n=1 Tax=Gonapodya prolifera (strain JEL478) TaxID=1344416 RepID=A0A139AIY0_GONPJ|nr:hypothetical protein M427DRAFT_134363 [Gonapodya prolifera JEL478]|eukprot:KXS16355.1 hypothetical protein M427DRAFT_134363 [Gonapodya prolifera JEL478]
MSASHSANASTLERGYGSLYSPPSKRTHRRSPSHRTSAFSGRIPAIFSLVIAATLLILSLEAIPIAGAWGIDTLLGKNAPTALLAEHQLRGIPPSKYDLYKPQPDPKNGTQMTFVCLSGKQRIPLSALNDDYCDCDDGSDEPGTSACPNSQFYCRNPGHVPTFIKSNRVNDGVCEPECCDGSDEWSNPGACPNRCEELAKVARADRLKTLGSRIEGAKTRAELTSKGKELKKVKERELKLLKSHIPALERQLAKLEETKKAAEAVASASQASASAAEPASTAEATPDPQAPIPLSPPQTFDDDDQDDNLPPYDPAAALSVLSSLPSPPPPPPHQESQGELPEVAAWRAKDNELNDTRNKIAELEKFLGRDYGNGLEWAAVVEDGCIDGDHGEYVYTLCAFDKTTQRSKNSGGTVTLGHWGSWVAAGQGESGGAYAGMEFTGGETCWNGPARSVKVSIMCHKENAILSVSEPAKCEYHMQLGSPIGCEPVGLDELREAGEGAVVDQEAQVKVGEVKGKEEL